MHHVGSCEHARTRISRPHCQRSLSRIRSRIRLKVEAPNSINDQNSIPTFSPKWITSTYFKMNTSCSIPRKLNTIHWLKSDKISMNNIVHIGGGDQYVARKGQMKVYYFECFFKKQICSSSCAHTIIVLIM